MNSYSTYSTISWNIKSYTDEVSGWNINLYIVSIFGKLVMPAVNYFLYLSLLIWAMFSPFETTWPILWQGCIVWVLRVSIKQSFPKTEIKCQYVLDSLCTYTVIILITFNSHCILIPMENNTSVCYLFKNRIRWIIYTKQEESNKIFFWI